MADDSVFILCFYVPTTHLEAVKNALFAVGGGRIGAYDHCAWETRGMGQFRPLPGSNAFLGDVGTIEHVEEYKVEMQVETDKLQAVVAALRDAHPYETPAFHYWEVSTP